METLSSLIDKIGKPTLFGRLDAFVGAAAMMLFLLEVVGPLIGYPTITGRLYELVNIESRRPVIWQLLLLGVPQIAVGAVAGFTLARSPWVRWIAVRAKGVPALTVPEVHARETALGIFAAIVIWLLFTLQIGLLPTERDSLVIGEAFLLGVGVVVVLIVVVFRPREQFQISDAEDEVVWVIPQAMVPTEIVLNPTTFLKAVALRKAPDSYVVVDATQPLRLDGAEHIVLNLAILERKVASSVEVASANVLKCVANLSVTTTTPLLGTRFSGRAVDYMVSNLYAKPDLIEFLKSQLGLAMDEYAAEFDPAVKSVSERLRIDLLRLDAVSSGSRARAGGTAPFAGEDPSVDDLETMRTRIGARLEEFERFRRMWVDARRLQETGKRDLPTAFDRRIRTHFREQIHALSADAWSSGEKLLECALPGVLVYDVELTDKAAEAERSLAVVVEASAADLRRVEERLSDERRKRREEFRGLLDDKLRSIDPRLMMTPRGKRLFEQLMAMRTLEWDKAIAEALPEMTVEATGVASASLSPPAAPVRATSPLRLGKGLDSSSGPSVRASPATPASSAAPASARATSGLRIGRTSRTPAPRPSDKDDDEPM